LFEHVVVGAKNQDLVRRRLIFGVDDKPAALVPADESEFKDSFGSVKNDWGDKDEEDWARLLELTDMSMDMSMSMSMDMDMDLGCRPYSMGSK
jgi:hypothetical protein